MSDYFLFLIIFFINFLIFLNLKKIIILINTYDLPDKKLKIHKYKTPILGGYIFFFNLLTILTYQIFFDNNFFFITKDLLSIREMISMIILIFCFFLLGISDDKFYLQPNTKIIYSIIILIIIIFLNFNLLIDNFSLSFYNHRIFLNDFAIIFTIFCFLILINSLNFYDGINGQSCLFYILTFIYLYLKSNYHNFYLLSVIIIFFILFLNLRGRIFLGDSGVYVIGSLLSLCLIYEHNIKKNIVHADEIFLLLILPGFDLLRLTITRILDGKNPFYGDRYHMHHLLSSKYSILSTNLILFFVNLFPIMLFTYFKLSFFFSFSSFLLIYVFLFTYLKYHDD